MKSVQLQTGTVLVVNDGQRYANTREEFKKDWAQDAPALPEGIDFVLYEPGVRHAYVKGNDVVGGGSMPWPEGDKLLSRVNEVVQRVQARDSDPEYDAEVKAFQEKNEQRLVGIAARKRDMLNDPLVADLIQALHLGLPPDLDKWAAEHKPEDILRSILRVLATITIAPAPEMPKRKPK